MTVTNYKLYAIKPKETINLCTNPSFETGTTGWNTLGTNTIAKSAVQQRRGVYSCKCTYTNNDLLASYAITLTDVDHVGAMDIYIPSTYTGTQLTLTWTGYTGGVVVNGLADMTIVDKWQRVHCHINPDSGDLAGTLTLSETGTNGSAAEFIYIDGVQIEAGTAPTTYLDGDMEGNILAEGVLEYYWTGQQHASTSVRTANTRAGGELVDISTYCKNILLEGLGVSPVDNISIPQTNGGEVYLYSNYQSRYFTLQAVFEGSHIGAIQAKRKALWDLIKPDVNAYPQPLVLRYQGFDENGNIASEPVDIKCQYVSGLDRSPQMRFAHFADITFRVSDTALEIDGDGGVVLGYQTAVSNVGNILQQGTDGVWAEVGGGLNSKVYCFAIHPVTGDLYVGGEFINAGADADADYLAKWNGTAWSSVFAGMTDIVRALLFDAAGNLYIGGEFLNVGDVNGDKIIKWDGSSISSLGTGLNGDCYTLTFDPNGDLIAGGAFTLAGGVANTVKIAKWDGSNWTALGTGATGGDVFTAIYARDDNLYVGGSFTLMGGVANTVHIAKWNGTAWTALSTGLGGNVRKIAQMESSIYDLLIGGEFTNAGGNANADYLAKWNGIKFDNIGDVLSGGIVQTIYVDNDKFYIGGTFTYYGSYLLPDRTMVYQGSTFVPLDINVDDALAFFNVFIRHPATGILYVGGDWSGTTAYSATVTVPNISGATTYPIITITGPGKIWQIKNYTTGKAIYFDRLTLNVGEIVKFDLRPENISIISKFRGNISDRIVKGSNLDFPLVSGNNNVSAYLYGSTTAATAVTMKWKPMIHSIDGAQYE